MTDLKPCPFCGGDAHVKYAGPGCNFGWCPNCGASTDDGTEERAIAAWNRRAPDPRDEVTVSPAEAQRHVSHDEALAQRDEVIRGLVEALEPFAFFGGMFSTFVNDSDGSATLVLYDGKPPIETGKIGRPEWNEVDISGGPIDPQACLFGICVGHMSVKGAIITPIIQAKHFLDADAALAAARKLGVG